MAAGKMVSIPGIGDRHIGEIPLNALFVPFEGLGNNCEFGIVQRRNGYDPPGLFRNVGFLNVEAMVNTIDSNLDRMFDEGMYRFVAPEGWPDWRLDCMRYGFGFHTAIPSTILRDTPEWQKKTRETIGVFRMLKRRFREDLQTGDKIFVFRFNLPVEPELIQRFHQAIRKHGPGWFLYIKQDPAHPFGVVEDAGDGLLLSAIDRLSNENPPQVNFDAWEAIARNCLKIRYGED